MDASGGKTTKFSKINALGVPTSEKLIPYAITGESAPPCTQHTKYLLKVKHVINCATQHTAARPYHHEESLMNTS